MEVGGVGVNSPTPLKKEEVKLTVNARGESKITAEILRDRRQYFVKEVKDPLKQSLTKIDSKREGASLLDRIRLLWDIWRIVRCVYRYPVPTKENTKKHISHVLLDLWDEFFEHERDMKTLFHIIERITVCECEHDNYYSQRMTRFLMKLTEKYLSGEWTPLEPWCPMDGWDDPVVTEELRKAAQEFRLKLTIGGRPFNEVET